MAANDKSKPKVWRSKKVAVLPPGKLSFSALLKPDDKFGDAQFYVNVEMDEHALDKLADQLKAELDAAYPKFKEQFYNGAAKGTRPEDCPPMVALSSWLEDQVKQPSDEKYLPFVKFKVKAEGKDKEGETFQRAMVIWDLKNNKLDLAKLRMGRGSIIQVVVKVGLFMTALVKVPTPTLQLVGVRVLKLVQFGGAANLDDVDPTDVEGLELDTDLSAFAAGSDRVKDDSDVEDEASPF